MREVHAAPLPTPARTDSQIAWAGLGTDSALEGTGLGWPPTARNHAAPADEIKSPILDPVH